LFPNSSSKSIGQDPPTLISIKNDDINVAKLNCFYILKMARKSLQNYKIFHFSEKKFTKLQNFVMYVIYEICTSMGENWEVWQIIHYKDIYITWKWLPIGKCVIAQFPSKL
jgi:hypothetical protein